TECQSGFCGRSYAGGAGTCTDGGAKSPCSDDSECQSEPSCAEANFGGRCTSGAVGEPCTDADDWDSGTCAEGSFENFCTEGKLDQPCSDNEQCEAGHCVRNYLSDGPRQICTDGSVGTRCDREEDADCAEGRCTKDSAGAGWTCSAGGIG